MATTPTLELCDDLVSALNTAWAPSSPDAVARKYLHRIDLSNLEGRQVFLFPTGYDSAPAARGYDDYTHRITALVVEHYGSAGDPANSWLDTRVDFVHTYIVQGFDYSHDGPPSFNRQLLTLSADVPDLYDAEKLATQKQFWCAVELVFQEYIAS